MLGAVDDDGSREQYAQAHEHRDGSSRADGLAREQVALLGNDGSGRSFLGHCCLMLKRCHIFNLQVLETIELVTAVGMVERHKLDETALVAAEVAQTAHRHLAIHRQLLAEGGHTVGNEPHGLVVFQPLAPHQRLSQQTVVVAHTRVEADRTPWTRHNLILSLIARGIVVGDKGAPSWHDNAIVTRDEIFYMFNYGKHHTKVLFLAAATKFSAHICTKKVINTLGNQLERNGTRQSQPKYLPVGLGLLL